MTKAKIDIDMGDGEHIIVSAEGETQSQALERAYSRSVAILKFVRAIESEADIVTFEPVPAPNPASDLIWEAVNREY